MRKKVIKVILILFSLLLIGVLSLFVLAEMAEGMRTTSNYRQAETIQGRVERGKTYTKEDIFRMLRSPDACYDGSEMYSRYDIYKGSGKGRYTKEEYDEIAYRKDVISWRYSIYRYTDPSDPYSISIEFNENGEVISFEMELIPGG